MGVEEMRQNLSEWINEHQGALSGVQLETILRHSVLFDQVLEGREDETSECVWCVLDEVNDRDLTRFVIKRSMRQPRRGLLDSGGAEPAVLRHTDSLDTE